MLSRSCVSGVDLCLGRLRCVLRVHSCLPVLEGVAFVTTDISEEHTVTVTSVGLMMCSRVNKAANVIVAFCRGLCYAIGTIPNYVCSDGSAYVYCSFTYMRVST